MPSPAPTCRSDRATPAGGFGRGRCRIAPGGFSLVEVLVGITIIGILMTLTAAAINSARTNAKAGATRQLIARLDTILSQQLETYDSRPVPQPDQPLTSGISQSAYRAWFIRRNLITGDLPDRWTDVNLIASGTTRAAVLKIGSQTVTQNFPITPTQSIYARIINTATSAPSSTFAGAECLFMIVMQGGIADCLDCGGLRTTDIGDKDNDTYPEFWDAWGNPIGYILWPAAVELPPGSGTPFFSGNRPLSAPFAAGAIRPTLGMRPLIYSAGPDGEYCLDRVNESATLSAGGAIAGSPNGMDCGNWQVAPTLTSGSLDELSNNLDGRRDNITNFDAEANKQP